MRFLVIALLASDLSVGWIARNPKIDYVWDSRNPTVEGWPKAGDAVTWEANVRWLGSEPLRGVTYRWLIDGSIAKSGTLDFEPQSVVKATLPWTWTFDRHEIVFEIDSGKKIVEANERNNRVLVHSNALGIGLYVERSFWDGIAPMLQEAGIGVTTFDDWMQRLVRRFNEMAQYATFPDTPNGVLDRWRIDEIHLVDDNALPLVNPYIEARDWGAPATSLATLFPNVLDHSVDMQWGFPASTVTFWPFHTPWIFMIGNSTLHEWAHARTMIDTYAWNVDANSDVFHTSAVPPAERQSRKIYASHEQGMMQFDWGHIDRYTAAAMNLMAGHRARKGNYNEPWDLGWFLNDIPAQNRVRFIRPDGSALAGRTIEIYRATPSTAFPYAMQYDEPPSFTMTTDGDGAVVLPSNLFTDTTITAFVDRTNGTAMVKIDDGGTRRWAFIESLEFNRAYWRGERAIANYTIMADAPRCHDGLGPSAVVPLPEALVTTPEVRFEFPATIGNRYELYYAIENGEPNRIELGAATASRRSVDVTLPPGRVTWWFIDTDPPETCPPQHSSIYGFDHQLENGPRRRAVRR